MQKILLNTVLAATLGIGPLGFTQVAGAQTFELGIGRDGAKVRVCDPDFEDCRDRGSDYRERRREAMRVCTQDRALDKADRMGIHRARIESAGRRAIEVRGRDRRGERVFITFGRAPNCPIIG